MPSRDRRRANPNPATGPNSSRCAELIQDITWIGRPNRSVGLRVSYMPVLLGRLMPTSVPTMEWSPPRSIMRETCHRAPGVAAAPRVAPPACWTQSRQP